jgi:hypothetical protein
VYMFCIVIVVLLHVWPRDRGTRTFFLVTLARGENL